MFVIFTVGSLSNSDDDGSEDIAKKMNLCPFKLYHVILDQFNLSNCGKFLMTLSRLKKRKENLSLYVHQTLLSIKHCMRRFHGVVMQ